MDRFGPTVKVPNEGQVCLSVDVSQVTVVIAIVIAIVHCKV